MNPLANKKTQDMCDNCDSRVATLLRCECGCAYCPKCVLGALSYTVRDSPYCMACGIEYGLEMMCELMSIPACKKALHSHQKETRFHNRLARLDDINRIARDFEKEMLAFFRSEETSCKSNLNVVVMNMLRYPCPSKRVIMRCPTKMCKGFIEGGRCQVCNETHGALPNVDVLCPNCFETIDVESAHDAQFCVRCKTAFSLLGRCEVIGYQHSKAYAGFIQGLVKAICGNLDICAYPLLNKNIINDIINDVNGFKSVVGDRFGGLFQRVSGILSYALYIRSVASKIEGKHEEYEFQLRKYDARHILGLLTTSMYKTHINNYSNKKRCLWHRLLSIRALIRATDVCISRYISVFHNPFKSLLLVYGNEPQRLNETSKTLAISALDEMDACDRVIQCSKEDIRKRDTLLADIFQMAGKKAFEI